MWELTFLDRHLMFCGGQTGKRTSRDLAGLREPWDLLLASGIDWGGRSCLGPPVCNGGGGVASEVPSSCDESGLHAPELSVLSLPSPPISPLSGVWCTP